MCRAKWPSPDMAQFEAATVSNSRITTLGVHPNETGCKVASILNDIFADPLTPQQIIDVVCGQVVGETS